jgi:thiol-disulfide isomerase/thioredoxin
MAKSAIAEKHASALQERGASESAEAYRAYMRACDVAATRRHAEDLLDEVEAHYGDIPFVRAGAARESKLRYRGTLGQAAAELLDEIRNLAIGKPLPAIEGLDLDGRPLKLADHRGKVVVLVFWASWCAPCMAEVPRERALAERHQGRPFVLLGVNCDEDQAAAQQAIESQRIDWPSWSDPFDETGEGPIANRLHVRALPSIFVLDASGILRAKNERGESLDAVVDKLVTEAETVASE